MKIQRATRVLPAFLAAAAAAIAVAGGSNMLREVVRGKNMVELRSDRSVTRVYPVGEGIFRIETLPAGSTERFPASLAAIVPGDSLPFSVTATPREVLIEAGGSTLRAEREGSTLSLLDAEGNTLVGETERACNGTGLRKIRLSGAKKGEHFYGAGERGHSLALNGDTLEMYNRQNYGYGEGDRRISQMNITVPYYVSDKGYGVFFDDYSKSRLILADTVQYISDSPDPVAYYLIDGKEKPLASTTEKYTALTGRQPLPPLWALGYITSKYGYRTADETLGAIDSLQSRGYPVDGIVLDLYWYGQETDMGRFDWNRKQFPDPEKMIADLAGKGVKLVTISQPYINKKGAIANYMELDSLGMLTKDSKGKTHDVTTWVGDAGMLDVSNPATRRWMQEKYLKLAAQGVAGFWGDLGEPEVHPSTIVHDNGLTAEQFHNLYGNVWSKLIADALAEAYPERRRLLLMRGGTAGLQRYSVFPWSTDVARSWEGLQPQVKIMLNSGLSGLGYMSSDIGGFAVDPKKPVDPELYVRWLEMGAFTPMLRTHAQSKPEPYHYPEYEKILKSLIRQRYNWLPYNYTLAYENARHGKPLARPLDWNGGGNADIADEYLWGDEVLVAPVMHRGAVTRKVVFPSGTWIDWHDSSRKYAGNTTATVKAPLGRLPLFVREGSFIPQCPKEIKNTGEYDPSQLDILYYPSSETTSYTLFDDDRVSPRSLENGEYRLTTFSGVKKGKEITVDIDSEGTYPGIAPVQRYTFLVQGIGKRPSRVEISGQVFQGWKYDAASRVLSIPVECTDKKADIGITL